MDIKSTSHQVSINRKKRENSNHFLNGRKVPRGKYECIPVKVWSGLAMEGVKVQQVLPVKNISGSPRSTFNSKARSTLGGDGFPQIFKN